MDSELSSTLHCVVPVSRWADLQVLNLYYVYLIGHILGQILNQISIPYFAIPKYKLKNKT
jgi:hypothetical protein